MDPDRAEFDLMLTEIKENTHRMQLILTFAAVFFALASVIFNQLFQDDKNKLLIIYVILFGISILSILFSNKILRVYSQNAYERATKLIIKTRKEKSENKN